MAVNLARPLDPVAERGASPLDRLCPETVDYFTPLFPHWFGVPPPPHVSGGVQVPQFVVPPQPSAIVPQVCCASHFAGVHGGAPHTFAMPPPPHVCPVGHVPQGIRFPQPSPISPHGSPASVAAGHASGVHLLLVGPQVLWPPAPHASPGPQLPH